MERDVVEKFLKHDYGETKDLLKTMISLVSGILVFSLTFAEKTVGNLAAADVYTKQVLVSSWGLLILSIVFSGIAMCFIAGAAGKVLYGELPILNWHYYRLALTAWGFTVLSGGSFIAGLGAMVFAAARGTKVI